MAYKRRYLAGQLAVTVDIADQAITSDKIDPGAVGPIQLRDNSVNTEKIIDGQVKSVDLGPLSVTSEKIQEAAVTESKIAPGAVTSSKLGADVQQSVRPFVPGLPTAEIGDRAITAVKIAPEAVETEAIKPGAVDLDRLAANSVDGSKIVPDSIDSDQIVASAIKTAELANLSVSEGKLIDGAVSNSKISNNAVFGDKIPAGGIGQNKIVADGVQTLQIENEAVTPPKIQIPALLLARDKAINRFYDDFMGDKMNPAWVQTGAAGFSVLPEGNSTIEIKTGALTGNDCRIDWGGSLGAGLTHLVFPKLTVGIRFRNSVQHLTNLIGLWNNASNYIAFHADSVGAEVARWKARCIKAGNLTEVDTGVNVGVGIQVLEIFFESLTSVFFDINGVEVAHIEVAASIPALGVEPRLEIITKEDVAKDFRPDFVSLLQTREVP